jgi:hypothetical protein
MNIMPDLRKASHKLFLFGIAVLGSFCLSMLPLAEQAIAADLELDSQSGSVGGQVVFTLSVNDAPNDVASLGVDIGFDDTVLTYVSADFAGTLLENFDFREISNPSAGVLRLGAFEAQDPFTTGSSGSLVTLTFDVIDCQDIPLPLSDLVDDISTWTTQDGSFTCIVGGPELVADFGIDGVWVYDGSLPWVFIAGWDPEDMIVWNNNIVGDFGINGLWLYDGSLPWVELAGWDPEGMIVWDNNLVGDFGIYGVWLYDGSPPWVKLAGWDPDDDAGMIVWDDNLVVDFGIYGVWVYDGSFPWVRISDWDPEDMVSVDFP